MPWLGIESESFWCAGPRSTTWAIWTQLDWLLTSCLLKCFFFSPLSMGLWSCYTVYMTWRPGLWAPWGQSCFSFIFVPPCLYIVVWVNHWYRTPSFKFRFIMTRQQFCTKGEKNSVHKTDMIQFFFVRENWGPAKLRDLLGVPALLWVEARLISASPQSWATSQRDSICSCVFLKTRYFDAQRKSSNIRGTLRFFPQKISQGGG